MRLKVWLGILLGLGMLHMADVGRADADYDQALKTAPQGISLAQIFTPGTTANNTAAVVSTTNPNVTGTQAARVNNGKKQFGALWSTDENAFDLTQNQSASMWLYFGNTGKKAADGMAFVLQNDSRKLAATPTYGKNVSGETLGVWGVDTDKRQTTPDKVAASAIQNSWALEFDTHLNTSTNYGNAGDADSFDVGLNGPHLATNYPGDPDSYAMERAVTYFPIYSSGYYATQKHEGVISGGNTFLANGEWHHLSLDWDAAKREMTYTFDDKNPSTGVEQSGKQVTVSVDVAKIDPQQTGQVRWGFTGATGESYENNLVVMEEIPGLVDATAKTKLTNQRTGAVVTDGDSLKGRDPIQLDYQLSYVAGKQDWQDVTAHLNLPEQLRYQDAQVTYADGTSQTIDLSELADNQLNVKLTRTLSQKNPTATISFTGEAADVKTPVTVSASGSTFSAVNGVVTADTVAFTLNPTLDLHLLSLSGSGTTVKPNENVTMKGLILVPDGGDLVNSDMQIQAQLNGTALTDFMVPDGDDNTSGQFEVVVPGEKLRAGENILTVTAYDPYGNASNQVKFTITVTRQLTFHTVAEKSSFVTTDLTGTNQRIKRTADWQLKVLDTREAGAKWSLQVTGTPFVSTTGQRLVGGVYYHDEQGKTLISNTPIAIHQGEAADEDKMTDVVDTWADDTGLLLEVSGGTVAGTYTGTLTWTLNDVPA
ncbi:lectin-like domain-containing protein [Levilactobacillus enshiensis]|uniref:lectin-like domain-containing protein n=1 Tax=Levilactobacillus enshiensis TaxID=2590213 RepID=UPI001179AEAB|nr:hypothetical protein [Levilactobacillus enshiensis]